MYCKAEQGIVDLTVISWSEKIDYLISQAASTIILGLPCYNYTIVNTQKSACLLRRHSILIYSIRAQCTAQQSYCKSSIYPGHTQNLNRRFMKLLAVLL